MLYSVESGTTTRNHSQGGANVQLLMSFLETPPAQGAAPALDALEDEQRTAIVTLLARLIANAAAARNQVVADVGENHDE